MVKAVTQEVRKCERGYKNVLLRVQAAYDTAVDLVKVFEDADFRADMGGADDFRLAEVLDGYCERCGLSFLELRALLEYCPRREGWREKPLRDQYEAMRDAQRAAGRDRNGEPKRSVERISRAQFEEIASKNDWLTARNTFLEAEVNRLGEENDDLKQRVTKLERDAAA